MLSFKKSRSSGRKLALVLLVFCSITSLYPQQFHSLDGIEDELGNTHLIYKFNQNWFDSLFLSVYRFELQSNTETRMIEAYIYIDPIWWDPQWKYADDFEFVKNNPYDFVNIGRTRQGLYDYIYLAKNDAIFSLVNDNNYGEVLPIVEISNSNSQNIYYSTQNLVYRSFDGGQTYSEDSIITFPLISVADFDDKTFFGLDTNQLVRSYNQGLSYEIVDTSRIVNDKYFKMLYDVNQFHIYRVNKTYGGYTLNVSNNKGNAFTWTKTYQSENPIYVAIDSTQSGVVYLADGRKIYKSINNGYTFSEYKSLPSKLIGIYKKPNSEILYTAASRKIYKITPDSTVVIKSIPVSPELFNYYPLAIGNYWIYKVTDWSYPYYSEDTFTRKVVSKETLSNGIEYFKIEEKYFNSAYTSYVYERIDTMKGFVFRFDNECANPDSEKVIDDFTSDVGDSLLIQRFTMCWDSILTKFSESGSESIFNENRNFRTYEYSWLMSYTHKLAKGIGIYNIRNGYDFGESYFFLNGCVINDVVYGDTILTDVDDQQNSIPTEYELEQNYPNPFNPSTIISFQLPVAGNVTLKVFDVLGKEVVTLVDEYRNAGSYNVDFRIENLPAGQAGLELSSGIYFYQLNAGDYFETKKMLLIK